MTPPRLVFLLAVLAFTGCVPPTPDEFEEQQARFNREFAKSSREVLEGLRGTPPRPIDEMRADATAKLNTLERLREKNLARLEELRRNPAARPGTRRYANNTKAHVDFLWHGINAVDRRRRAIASDDWWTIQHADNDISNQIRAAEQHLAETNRRLRRLGVAVPLDAGAEPSAPTAAALSMGISRPIEDIRAEGAAALAEVENLHDELIQVLQAVAAAYSDPEDHKVAQDQVTLARFTKRQDLERWRADIDSDEIWRVHAGRRTLHRAKTDLENQIEDARNALRSPGSPRR